MWATRIDNILGQDALSSGGRASRLALALSFTVLGVALLITWWQARRRELTSLEAGLVRVAAAWTVIVWLVRGTGIALGDNSGAFIAVHTVLAVVSIGLAVAATRTTTMPVRHGSTSHRRPEANVA